MNLEIVLLLVLLYRIVFDMMYLIRVLLLFILYSMYLIEHNCFDLTLAFTTKYSSLINIVLVLE